MNGLITVGIPGSNTCMNLTSGLSPTAPTPGSGNGDGSRYAYRYRHGWIYSILFLLIASQF